MGKLGNGDRMHHLANECCRFIKALGRDAHIELKSSFIWDQSFRSDFIAEGGGYRGRGGSPEEALEELASKLRREAVETYAALQGVIRSTDVEDGGEEEGAS